MKRVFKVFGLVALLSGAAACHPDEGERCNPLLFTDECNPGEMCTYPTNCGVAYCCPPPARITSKTSGNCRPCPGHGGSTD